MKKRKNHSPEFNSKVALETTDIVVSRHWLNGIPSGSNLVEADTQSVCHLIQAVRSKIGIP